jgi:hypothetical protein
MISKKGTEFSATVQFNADKRYVEFCFDKQQSSKTPNKTISKANRRKLQELSEVKNWMMSSTTSSKPDKLFM